ncbi:DoxX family protein [Pedococcus sp. NPDC057267]|uniref:DoxX family protein n=1 Tax=Pedococcus sp. NPDC057267 TaxID=3346077 RepID=UPI003626DD82
MNVVVWVVQVVLALFFAAAGLVKLSRRKEELRQRMAWVDDFSQGTVRLIGAAEVLGALGLVLPAATGVATWLTPTAALGLVVVMLGAIATHLRRREPQVLPVNVVLLLLAAFVAWQRFGPHPL